MTAASALCSTGMRFVRATVPLPTVTTPTVATGGIATFEQAEAILQRGEADIAGFARQALGLGVANWRSVLSITLKTASPGIITGCMLAFSRVAGETAPGAGGDMVLLQEAGRIGTGVDGIRPRRYPLAGVVSCAKDAVKQLNKIMIDTNNFI